MKFDSSTMETYDKMPRESMSTVSKGDNTYVNVPKDEQTENTNDLIYGNAPINK